MDELNMAKDLKKWLMQFVNNFPLIIWREGYFEGILPFFDNFGKNYSSHHVDMLRKWNQFSEEEIQLLFELEEILLKQIQQKSSYWIQFSYEDYHKIETIRKEFQQRFNMSKIEE